jgi:FixJ family two-component response regulator
MHAAWAIAPLVMLMPTAPKIIAVVEDDSDMRKGLVRLLKASGFQAQIFASAEEFLAVDNKSELTCALLDIRLDGMSGIELRQRLAVSHPQLPIIFMAAIVDERVRAEALQAGCVAFLQKPFTAALLIRAISQATSVK